MGILVFLFLFLYLFVMRMRAVLMDEPGNARRWRSFIKQLDTMRSMEELKTFVNILKSNK